MLTPSLTKTYHHTSYPDIDPANPNISATGKVVFITGGGTGIGKSIARSFVIAGAKAVIVSGRREKVLQETKEELSTLGKSRVECFVADTTNLAAIEKAFSSTVQLFGSIDVLVENAGYLPDQAFIKDSKLDDYWLGFEINVKGPLTTTQAFLKVAKPNATLINVTSGAAIFPYIPTFSSYAASKMASAKIIEYVHHEHPELRVFNLQPAATETDMSHRAPHIPTTDDLSMCHDSYLQTCYNHKEILTQWSS